jgi:hypothetical protein
MQADIIHVLFPNSRRLSLRVWYYVFLGLMTLITCLTMLLDTPGSLILTSAVIGFAGTVIFPVALYLLNYRRLAPILPVWARPGGAGPWLLGISFLIYLMLAGAYGWSLLKG